MAILTLQINTPSALPASEQVTSSLDAVNLPFQAAVAIMDAVRSVSTFSQAGTIDIAVNGQLSVVHPVFTITYASATGAQTVTIGGVAVPSVPAAGASDTITAANTAAAINASLAHSLVCSATSSGAVVTVTGHWPGPGLNTVATNATTGGGTVQVSGGTAGLTSTGTMGGGTAGVNWSQKNTMGIGTPAFP